MVGKLYFQIQRYAFAGEFGSLVVFLVSFFNICFLPILHVSILFCSSLIVCLLQGKLTQPKDDSWSHCAKTGYAGIMVTLGDFN